MTVKDYQSINYVLGIAVFYEFRTHYLDYYFYGVSSLSLLVDFSCLIDYFRLFTRTSTNR